MPVRTKTVAIPHEARPSRIAERWGGSERMFDKGFLSVPVRFLRGYALGKSPLTTNEAMTLLLVMTFKWGADKPFPSYTRLGRMMGISPRMVGRYIVRLENKGYMRRTRRPGTTNEFDLSPAFKRIEHFPVTRAEVHAQAETAREVGKKMDL